MNLHLRALAVLCLVVMVPAATPPVYGNEQQDTQRAFFESLKKMCGRRFEGETIEFE